jgi:regulator of sigma E protease
MTLIYFILILGITIFIHELGHFIFAKRAGIYVYEFAIGMGPKLFSKKRKNDETTYSIRLIPLGGFVQLAGENIDDDKDVPNDRKLQSKTWMQRFSTIVAGAMFNFLLAIILLFIIGLFYGSPNTKPIINSLEKDYPAYNSGLSNGDKIIAINDKKVKTWDDVLVAIELKGNKTLAIKVIKENSNIKTYIVTPKKEVINNQVVHKIGIGVSNKKEYGIFTAVQYAVVKTASLFKTMYVVITSLITGSLSLNAVSGPVGIYNVVGEQAKAGFDSVLYLIAFLSINVGFINLIPFPAFDGGRILFLVIEKIIGRPVSSKVENYFHTIGFFLLMALMVYITCNDIIKLS